MFRPIKNYKEYGRNHDDIFRPETCTDCGARVKRLKNGKCQRCNDDDWVQKEGIRV